VAARVRCDRGWRAVRARGHVSLAALDPALAERLARAAVQAGAGFRAELALGRALAASGRGLEADRLLAACGRPCAAVSLTRCAVHLRSPE
jgi:hypothetical protein